MIKAFEHGIELANHIAVKIISRSVICKRKRTRRRSRGTDIIDRHIIDNLFDAQFLHLFSRRFGQIRQNPLNSVIHTSCGICRNRLGIGNIMLVAHLNHLPVLLYRNQKFTAEIGIRRIIIQRKTHRNGCSRIDRCNNAARGSILKDFIRINIELSVVARGNAARAELTDNIRPGYQAGINRNRTSRRFHRLQTAVTNMKTANRKGGCDRYRRYQSSSYVFHLQNSSPPFQSSLQSSSLVILCTPHYNMPRLKSHYHL